MFIDASAKQIFELPDNNIHSFTPKITHSPRKLIWIKYLNFIDNLVSYTIGVSFIVGILYTIIALLNEFEVSKFYTNYINFGYTIDAIYIFASYFVLKAIAFDNFKYSITRDPKDEPGRKWFSFKYWKQVYAG